MAAGALVVSIAAGIRTESLAGWLGGHKRIVVMPNTPALVQAGFPGCLPIRASANDRDAAQRILAAGG